MQHVTSLRLINSEVLQSDKRIKGKILKKEEKHQEAEEEDEKDEQE